MKAFEMIIEDGERVFKCVRPAKDINQVKQIYGGNALKTLRKNSRLTWTICAKFCEVKPSDTSENPKRI